MPSHGASPKQSQAPCKTENPGLLHDVSSPAKGKEHSNPLKTIPESPHQNFNYSTNYEHLSFPLLIHHPDLLSNER